MALDVASNPFVFDAAGQEFGDKVYIVGVLVTTGVDSGEFQLSESLGGRDILPQRAINAEQTVWYGELGWVRSLYLTQLPAGGEIRVFIR